MSHHKKHKMLGFTWNHIDGRLVRHERMFEHLEHALEHIKEFAHLYDTFKIFNGDEELVHTGNGSASGDSYA